MSPISLSDSWLGQPFRGSCVRSGSAWHTIISQRIDLSVNKVTKCEKKRERKRKTKTNVQMMFCHIHIFKHIIQMTINKSSRCSRMKSMWVKTHECRFIYVLVLWIYVNDEWWTLYEVMFSGIFCFMISGRLRTMCACVCLCELFFLRSFSLFAGIFGAVWIVVVVNTPTGILTEMSNRWCMISLCKILVRACLLLGIFCSDASDYVWSPLRQKARPLTGNVHMLNASTGWFWSLITVRYFFFCCKLFSRGNRVS